MNKGDAQPGVHVQNTQITQKTAVHEQNADFAFRTACGCVVATIKKAFLKATVELEASLATQAVAGSRVSRFESEPRSRVEEL